VEGLGLREVRGRKEKEGREREVEFAHLFNPTLTTANGPTPNHFLATPIMLPQVSRGKTLKLSLWAIF